MTATTAATFTIPGHSTETLWAGWGVYSLPTGVVAHGRAYVALAAAAGAAKDAHDAAKAADGQAARLAAIDAAIAHAIATGAVPADPTAPLLAARRLAEDAALRLDILRDAVSRQGLNVESVVALAADEIAVEHLRPAFSAVLASVAVLGPDLAGVDVTDTGSVSARPPAGPAFLALLAARDRLDAIHGALDVLRTRAHRGQEDSGRLFRDTHAMPGGPDGRTTSAGRRPAGPEHPLERLVWLATDPDAEPWLPTLDEWDSRYRDWFFADTPANRPEAVAAANAARTAELDRMRAAHLARQAANRTARAG